MKQIIVGTAGHIDHGKTALVKALTGVNTDRLKEEQEHGITIELGFAPLPLPSGNLIGIVDVPGHERFVKTMVAGAQGIDLVMLIIAADEGIMPQTREHLAILRYLDIKHGLIVINKADLVEPDWLALVTEEIQEFVADTFLAGQPIGPVSARTGLGIPELIGELDRMISKIPLRAVTGPLRLPIDRVFSMKGFGTVITGTLLSGAVAVGDAVEIMPARIMAKIRGIQVFNEKVDQVTAGNRTAINFQGIDKEEILRGFVITTPNAFIPADRLDVFFAYRPGNNRPLKNRSDIRFHHGTSEIMAKIHLLGLDEVPAGGNAYAQISLEEPVIAALRDNFVLRSYSPAMTIGGGIILHPGAPAYRKKEISTVLPRLQILHKGRTDEILASFIHSRGYLGIGRDNLFSLSNLPEKKFHESLGSLIQQGIIFKIVSANEKIYLHRAMLEQFEVESLNLLSEFHKTQPLKPGFPVEELKSRLLAPAEQHIFAFLLDQLVAHKTVVLDKEVMRLAGFSIELGESGEKLRDRILKIYEEHQLSPPTLKELLAELGGNEKESRSHLNLLIKAGLICRVKDDLFFHHSAMRSVESRLLEFLRQRQEISPVEFKELTATSRKFAIPLLEYFDSQKITVRLGDKRILTDKFKNNAG
jgi:selenocysteine-specific elongation factor